MKRLLVVTTALTALFSGSSPASARPDPASLETPPTVAITLSLPTVFVGETATVRWAAPGATSCRASGAWSGDRPAFGKQQVGPLTSPGTFSLECANRVGKASRSVGYHVTQRPNGGIPAFDLSCLYSHSLRDDPIVHPGQPGASHLHDFVGATVTNAHSDFQSLSALLGTGRTTCAEVVPGGKNERDKAAPMLTNQSAMWFPALFQNGKQVPLNHLHLYYRNEGNRSAEAFPPGFRMIAGPFAGPQEGGDLVWFCRSQTDGGKATWNRLNPNCIGEQTVKAMFSFPSCWDGRPDSADHRSHVSYGRCKGGRKLPRLLAILHYRLPSRLTPADLLADWRLASGGLETMHGDYLFAWDSFRLDFLVHTCLNGRVNCKLDPPHGGHDDLHDD